MRNDAGVFCAGLFLTWIYGFNWQALEENAESPHPASSITRRLLSAVWWTGLVDGVSVRFLPFPSQLQQSGAAFLLASSLGRAALNFSSLALVVRELPVALQFRRKENHLLPRKGPERHSSHFTWVMLKRDRVVGGNQNDEQSPGRSFCPQYWIPGSVGLLTVCGKYLTQSKASIYNIQWEFDLNPFMLSLSKKRWKNNILYISHLMRAIVTTVNRISFYRLHSF